MGMAPGRVGVDLRGRRAAPFLFSRALGGISERIVVTEEPFTVFGLLRAIEVK